MKTTKYAVSSVVLLLLVLAIGSGTASADTVTFSFGGNISVAFNTPGVQLGDSFRGSFSYDPNVVFVSPFNSGITKSFPAISFQTTIDGRTLRVAEPEVLITNDNVFNDFALFGEVEPGLYMGLNLVGNRSWPNWTLPDALNLADWCCAENITLNNSSKPVLEQASLFGPGTTLAALGELNRLHQVPEPPTIFLVAGVAVVLLGSGCRLAFPRYRP